MPVYAVQHKTTKAYKLFLANDENVNQVANSIIQKASNPFCAIDNDVKIILLEILKILMRMFLMK